jgi:site-specific recombinase XerD
MIRKIYRERIKTTWEIVEKETVDEIIFRTIKQRDRLILELMARGGMRIGEVLKLTFGRHRGPKAAAKRAKIRQRA